MQFTGKKNHALRSGVPVMWRDGVRWELDHHISIALFQVSVNTRKLIWIVDIPCHWRILGVFMRECAPTAHEGEQRRCELSLPIHSSTPGSSCRETSLAPSP